MCSRSYKCVGARLKVVVMVVVFVVIIVILFLIIIIIVIVIFIIVIIIIIIVIVTVPATDAGQNLCCYNHLTPLVLIVNGKYNVQISVMNILLGTKIFTN
jgi:hypothetical protein